MKKIFAILLSALFCCIFISCGDDEWGNGIPEMEHVYYVGFDWGGKDNWNNNRVEYDITKGGTMEIPVEFYSERVRSYDVVVFYYVSNAAGDLVRGVDYQITDESGNVLEPDAKGAFSITFPQAKKGIKNVFVKSLATGQTGSFTMFTFDPNAGEIAYPDNITNSQTADYEVRSFTRNYRVKVNVK